MTSVSQNRIKIIASSNLSTDQTQTLTLLYGPLILPRALALYLTCHSLLERATLHSPEYPLAFLFDTLSLTPSDFKSARHKLEATGLCETYVHNDNYVMKLYAPLTPEGFIKDSPMSPYLRKLIGEHRFNDLIDHFKIRHLKLNDYKTVSVGFNDVFGPIESGPVKRSAYVDVKRKQPVIEHVFDMDLILDSISSSLISVSMKTKRVKQKIINLAYTYSLDEITMQPLIRASLKADKTLDFQALEEACQLQYQNTPRKSFMKKTDRYDGDYFKSVHPKTMLTDLTGSEPSLSELQTIQRILEESSLKIEVINILIAYVLKSLNHQFPSYNYFAKVIGEWQRNSIETVDDALSHVEQKLKQKSTPSTKNYRKKDTLDTNVDWFDAYLKSQKAG